MSPQADLEERVERLERVMAAVIAWAELHPVGRKILAKLGIE